MNINIGLWGEVLEWHKRALLFWDVMRRSVAAGYVSFRIAYISCRQGSVIMSRNVANQLTTYAT